MDENRIMEVTDEKGNMRKMYVIFTTTLEETGKNYVFYTDPEDKEGRAFVSTYDDEGHLGAVESDDEWNKLEETFNAFLEDKKSCENCHKDENEDCDGNCACQNGENCDHQEDGQEGNCCCKK